MTLKAARAQQQKRKKVSGEQEKVKTRVPLFAVDREGQPRAHITVIPGAGSTLGRNRGGRTDESRGPPWMACFAFLVRPRTARFRCDDSFCQAKGAEGFDVELSRLRSVILTIATVSVLCVTFHVKSKGVFATGFEEELWVGHLSTVAQSALQIPF